MAQSGFYLIHISAGLIFILSLPAIIFYIKKVKEKKTEEKVENKVEEKIIEKTEEKIIEKKIQYTGVYKNLYNSKISDKIIFNNILFEEENDKLSADSYKVLNSIAEI